MHLERLREPLRLVLPLLFCITALSCSTRKLEPDELQRNRLITEILRREDARTPGEDDLFRTNLSGPDPEVQEWCAVGLGRIGSPRALPWLYDALQGRYASVRAAAAFAIGQIEDRPLLTQEGRNPDPNAIPALMRVLDDSAPAVQMRAIEALGKMGSHSEAVEIVRRLEGFRYEGLPLQKSYLDLSITALMRLRDNAALPIIGRLSTWNDPDIQWRAENALVRMGDKDARPIFLRLLDSSDPDVQAYAARGLGICEDGQLADRLTPLLQPRNLVTGRPIPLSVRVCAVQSLGNLRNPAAIPAIARALEAEPADEQHPDQVNFAVQAAAALGKLQGPEVEGALVRLVRAGGPPADSAIAALAQVMKSDPDRFFAVAGSVRFTDAAAKRAWARALGTLGGARASDALRELLAQSARGAAAALGQMLAQSPNDGREMSARDARQILARSADKSVDRADMLALPAVIDALAKAQIPDLQEVIKPFLDFHDPVVLRSAVAAYKPQPGSREPWGPLAQAYKTAAEIGAVETTVAILNSLEPWVKEGTVQDALRLALHDRQRNARIAAARLLRLAGAGQVPENPGAAEGAATELACNVLATARKDRTTAVIETARGNIELELFREDAPLTVANFESLAKRGFYDGLSFMRVVPFFVIQGGDPRNDQEGGPGYSIRCEINMRPYERGSVGMALSGKDTGGSQFFITLAPQPHLDGRYTCFGRVISGMQVAERIVPGDRIKKVTIHEDAALLDYRSY